MPFLSISLLDFCYLLFYNNLEFCFYRNGALYFMSQIIDKNHCLTLCPKLQIEITARRNVFHNIIWKFVLDIILGKPKNNTMYKMFCNMQKYVWQVDLLDELKIHFFYIFVTKVILKIENNDSHKILMLHHIFIFVFGILKIELVCPPSVPHVIKSVPAESYCNQRCKEYYIFKQKKT